MSPQIAQAFREKKEAEEQIIAKDYVSARDKLLRAQHLFPGIQNIVPMITVTNILAAGSIEFPGSGIDYYWVIQLTPNSSSSAVRSRYEKLTALLKPIRSRFPGTDLALKLVQDAFFILSDYKKRSEYDIRRDSSWKQYKSISIQLPALPSQIDSCGETVTSAQSSSVDRASTSCTIGKSNERTKEILQGDCSLDGIDIDQKSASQKCSHHCTDTSSTTCRKSGEMTLSTGSVSSPVVQHDKSGDIQCVSLGNTTEKRPCQHFYDFASLRKLQLCEAGEIWAIQPGSYSNQGSRYCRIESRWKDSVSIKWLKPMPITSSERRWCDIGLPVAGGSFELSADMIHVGNFPKVSSHKCSWIHGVTEEQFEIYPKRGEIWAIYKDWDLDEWTYNVGSGKGYKIELVEIMSDFSKYLGADAVCLTQINGFRSIFQRQKIGGQALTFHIPPANLYIFSHAVPAYRFKGGELPNVSEQMVELDPSALPDYNRVAITTLEKTRKGDVIALPSPEDILIAKLSFSKLSSEDEVLKSRWCSDDFAKGQVWALCCGEDCLPRQYGRVEHVISDSLVCVTVLRPLPILDIEIEWEKENLPITCGIFKATETKLNLKMSQFSHPVKYQQSNIGSFYRIYPLKGEIWALYKNWREKWRQTDIECCQFQVVQVLSDFTDGDGIKVAILKDVMGCLTFFHRQQIDGYDLTHVVSKHELLSFSHRIPAFKVPGIGCYGIPESSWHLESYASPPKGRI